jgi:hypothetical protein
LQAGLAFKTTSVPAKFPVLMLLHTNAIAFASVPCNEGSPRTQNSTAGSVTGSSANSMLRRTVGNTPAVKVDLDWTLLLWMSYPQQSTL